MTPRTLRELVLDDSGAALVEYALLLSLVALAAIVAISKLDKKLVTIFKVAARDIKKG